MTKNDGTLKTFLSDLPTMMITAVVFICTIPITLNLLGVNFGTPMSPFDAQIAPELQKEEIVEAMFLSLKGSYWHTILEWSAFCAAIFTAVLAFSHYKLTGSIVTFMVGVAIGFAGFMDAFHTLAADRLINAVADNKQLIPFTWAICRLFNGLIIFSVMTFFLFKKKRSENEEGNGSLYFVLGIIAVMGGAAYIIIQYCATSALLPRTMFPDSVITRPWDIYPLVVFVLSVFIIFPMFYKKYPSVFSAAIILSVLPDIAVQLHMAFGSKSLFDNHFNIAHFLKIFSYVVPLMGLVVDYTRTYKTVNEAKLKVEESLKNAESDRARAVEAQRVAEENQRKAEKAEESKEDAESTVELMLDREEKVIELTIEVERLKKKYGDD